MRIVVSGGAGFLGSHVCETLPDRGDEVVCLDDWSTSSPADDPARRRPVVDIAADRLNWTPSVQLEEGVRRTVEWFRSRAEEFEVGAAALAGGQLGGAVVAPRA